MASNITTDMNAKNTDPNPSPAKRRKVKTLRDYVMTSAE
jgi:hypothetical protein